jgi:hypothetical protein
MSITRNIIKIKSKKKFVGNTKKFSIALEYDREDIEFEKFTVNRFCEFLFNFNGFFEIYEDYTDFFKVDITTTLAAVSRK